MPGSDPRQADLDRRVALRAALFSFAGAILGAAFALVGTWMTVHEQTKSEDAARHRLAVGTARLMIEGFDNATLRLCEVGSTGRFLIVTPHLRPELAGSDRRLLAGELTAREAQQVADADQSMATWEALYRKFSKHSSRIDPRSEGVDIAVGKSMKARTALQRVADLTSSGQVVCDTGTWKHTVAG